jgi:hypothetical protein
MSCQWNIAMQIATGLGQGCGVQAIGSRLGFCLQLDRRVSNKHNREAGLALCFETFSQIDDLMKSK